MFALHNAVTLDILDEVTPGAFSPSIDWRMPSSSATHEDILTQTCRLLDSSSCSPQISAASVLQSDCDHSLCPVVLFLSETQIEVSEQIPMSPSGRVDLRTNHREGFYKYYEKALSQHSSVYSVSTDDQSF